MKKSISYLLILLFFSLMSLAAKAEYRVYQYYVKALYDLPYDQNAYVVTSTLDPVSYLAYNGGQETLKVDLIRTWTCFGHTGSATPICSSPSKDATSVVESDNEGN